MINFRKSARCPSSEELLRFEGGEISPKKGKEICAHLTDCEFCASEVEFYAHYPQGEDEAAAAAPAKVEIPSPLYELAKALLDNKHKDFSMLNRLLCETVEM